MRQSNDKNHIKKDTFVVSKLKILYNLHPKIMVETRYINTNKYNNPNYSDGGKGHVL